MAKRKASEKSSATKAAKRPSAKAAVKKAPSKAPKKMPINSVPKLDRKQQAVLVCEALREDYPDAVCALNFRSPFQLLVATILSAQCTDERVNLVTKELFKVCPTPAKLAVLPQEELEQIIKSTGFFRNKAKSLKAVAEALVNDHHSRVPKQLDELVQLPGIGRKTANVVLGTAHGIPTGVVVDTHVTRLCNRLGLTATKDAVKIEKDLMEVLPEEEWIDFSHRMIYHGRQVCNARKPRCGDCSMKAFCPQVGVETAA